MELSFFHHTGTELRNAVSLGSYGAIAAALIAHCVFLLAPAACTASPDTGDSAQQMSWGGSGSAPTMGSYKTGILETNGNYFASYTDEYSRMVIMQSSDRGESWLELFRSSEGGPQPAALAADAAGSVYAVYSTWRAKGRFLRFDPDAGELVLFRASFESEAELDQWQFFDPSSSWASTPEALWSASGNIPPDGGFQSAKLSLLAGEGLAYIHELPAALADECGSHSCELRYWVSTRGGDGTGYGAYVSTFGNTHGGYLQTTPTDWRQRTVKLPPSNFSDRNIFIYLQTPGMAAYFDEIEIVRAEVPNRYVLAVDRDQGRANSKFAFVYNPVHDVLHWSRRDSAGNMEVVTLDTRGDIIRRRTIATGVDDAKGGHWDAHYQTLAVDPWGSLHLLYNPHYWPDQSDPNTFERVAVLYLRSDDAGATWGLSDGTPVSTPFPVDDFYQGGELISSEPNAYVVNLLVTDIAVHMLYWTYGPQDSRTTYVRLNRATGFEEQRSLIETGYHSVLVEDPSTDLLYLVGDGPSGMPHLYRSVDGGDNWLFVRGLDLKREGDRWNFSTGYSRLASSRFVIVLASNIYSADSAEVWFLRYDTSPLGAANSAAEVFSDESEPIESGSIAQVRERFGGPPPARHRRSRRAGRG